MSVALISLWELLAEKLAAHPELLAVARENCARWLREEQSSAARLRDFHPLAGILTREEQRRTRELCSYWH